MKIESNELYFDFQIESLWSYGSGIDLSICLGSQVLKLTLACKKEVRGGSEITAVSKVKDSSLFSLLPAFLICKQFIIVQHPLVIEWSLCMHGE